MLHLSAVLVIVGFAGSELVIASGSDTGLRIVPGDTRPKPYKPVMMWGGLRGAVAVALILSLPTELTGWYAVQSIVYGVVLFTLFVQVPAMPAMVRRTI